MTTYTQTDGTVVTDYSTKETAALIRPALKAAFPGVTFSVKIHLYSMGSSIYVRWTDGPTAPEVNRLLARFSSQTFDGMTDSSSYHTQIVDGRVVSYSGSISTTRTYSPAFKAMATQRAAADGRTFDDNDYRNSLHGFMYALRPNGCRVTLKNDWSR